MSSWIELWEDIKASLEAAYPREGCGLILESDDAWTWRSCANLADEYHHLDPHQYPRDSRTSYHIDPLEILRAAALGEELRFIVHSHVDTGAQFSAEDTRAALMPGGKPAFPEVGYLVVGVWSGRAKEARVFRYQETGFVADATQGPQGLPLLVEALSTCLTRSPSTCLTRSPGSC